MARIGFIPQRPILKQERPNINNGLNRNALKSDLTGRTRTKFSETYIFKILVRLGSDLAFYWILSSVVSLDC
jgi:hypothetical protein